MKFKGTKGEWRIDVCDNKRSIIATDEKSLIDVWYALSDSFPSKKEGIANAKLIAAAPDLLEALQILFKSTYPNYKTVDDSTHPANLALKAINKALN
jgi:hypothetical protein